MQDGHVVHQLLVVEEHDIGGQRQIPFHVFRCVLCHCHGHGLGFLLEVHLNGHACQVERTAGIVVGHVVGGQHLVGIFHHLCGAVGLVLFEQALSQT